MTESLRSSAARRITLLGAGKNALLAGLKIVFGIIGHSHALLADGVHSLSDLLIDTLVLVASHFGSKAADHDHPYGHGRIETAATVLLAIVMFMAGILIIYEAAIVLLSHRSSPKSDFWVLLVAVFSVVVNEILYFYTRRVGERVKSNLLIANAWHHRSDSVSSVVVLVGIIAVAFGLGKFDVIAAIVVGLMIIKMAWEFGFSSLRELVDTGLDDATVAIVQESIQSVNGVKALHQLRSRLMGGAIFLDVHIQVQPTISVSEGHFISQQVHYKLLERVSGVTDVTVHIDPEDDENAVPSRYLPERAAVIALLQQRWHNLPVLPYLDSTILHYLSGHLWLELRLPLTWLTPTFSPQDLTRQLQAALHDQPKFAPIKLLFVLN